MANHNEDNGSNVAAVVGAALGGVAGTVGSIGAVSAAGSVSGLSAAGITSGLAAIGGGMVGGIAVTAAAPVITAGAVGYLAYKLWKWDW